MKRYKSEITAIAKNNNADIGVAADMFIANIRNAGNPELPHYKGAGGFDYSALKPELEALVDSKAAFVDEWGKELWGKK